MQTTFLELHDSAMNCLSKNPDIAAVSFGNNLKDLTERFLGLAKGALGSSEGAESADEDAEGESINEEENGGIRSKRRRSRDDGSPGSGGMQGGGGGGGGGGALPSYGGYQVSYSRENGNGRGSRSSYDNSGNQNRSAGGGSGRNNTMTTNSPLSSNFHLLYSSAFSECERARELVQNPSMGLSYPAQFKRDNPLGVDGFSGMDAFSYSYHEASFARRLHRAGLEHAHMMLSSPSPDERELARLFAYTFCYVSKERALETITKLLRTSPKDSLDPNDYPEFSRTLEKPLGYADLLRRNGGLKADEKFEDVHPADVDLSHEARTMIVKLGINLKYLGPTEVEQYIKDLGILTTTDTSVVDPDLMDVDMELGGSRQRSQTTSSSYSSSSSSFSSSSTAVTRPISPSAAPAHRPAEGANPTSQQGGFTSATVMSFEYPPPSLGGRGLTRLDKYAHAQLVTTGEANTKSSPKVLEGVKKFVDLDMFVKRMSFPDSHQPVCLLTPYSGLVPHGVCLGRYPGFKKSDVEAAISLATTQVY